MSQRELRISDFGLRIGVRITLSLLLLVLVAAHATHGQGITCPDGLCPVDRNPTISQLSPLNARLSAASCRITVGDGSTGSGTLVACSDTTGVVLTCSHLFDDSVSNVVVTFPNGRRYGARVFDRDRAHDLAALLIRRPDVEPVAIDDDSQPVGLLTACGYGPDGRFRCVRGNVVGQATPVGATYPSVVVSGAVRPGDSGGGVLNTAGRLVGVVWGQRNGQTYLTCGRPLRRFLARVLGNDSRTASQPPALPGDPAAGNAVTDANPPAEPGADWADLGGQLESLASRISALKSDIAALREGKQDKGRYLTADVVDNFARRDDVDGGLASLWDRLGSVRERIDAVAGGRVGLLQGLSMGKLVVGALGLSGPVAAAVVIAGGLAGRRLKARQPPALPGDRTTSKPSNGANPPAEPGAESPCRTHPIAVDSPPLPQRSVPETHYVPYETDSFAKAYQWASEQVARKYPGTLDVLTSLDSLIKQQINAQLGAGR